MYSLPAPARGNGHRNSTSAEFAQQFPNPGDRCAVPHLFLEECVLFLSTIADLLAGEIAQEPSQQFLSFSPRADKFNM